MPQKMFICSRMVVKDLVEKSTNALVANGFSKDKIIMALPSKAGDVG